MTSDAWDHIRIEGGGEPLPRRGKVYRNGELIPGLTGIKLEGDVNGAWKLTTVQLVNVDEIEVDIDPLAAAVDLTTVTDMWVDNWHLVPDPKGNVVVRVNASGTFTIEDKEPPRAEQ